LCSKKYAKQPSNPWNENYKVTKCQQPEEQNRTQVLGSKKKKCGGTHPKLMHTRKPKGKEANQFQIEAGKKHRKFSYCTLH